MLLSEEAVTSLGIRPQRQAGGRCGQECVFVQGGGYWHCENSEDQGTLEFTISSTPLLFTTALQQYFRSFLTF